MSPVLKLDPAGRSAEKELEFELEYQRSLTTAQRFALMLERSRQIQETLLRHGHRRPFEITKRP